MTEIRKQRFAVFLPLLMCVVSIISISFFWQYQYRQAAFQHLSKFCEFLIADAPEAEFQVLSAMKEYHMQTASEMKGSEFLKQYGYSSSEFCEDVPWLFLFLPWLCYFLLSLDFCLSSGTGIRVIGCGLQS